MHKNPIKRETVQVLHQKLQSVGAQKGVLVSTDHSSAAHWTSRSPMASLWFRHRGSLHI